MYTMLYCRKYFEEIMYIKSKHLMNLELMGEIAQKSQKLRGSNMIEFLVTGHKFINGELENAD